jgi:hypothetical protein
VSHLIRTYGVESISDLLPKDLREKIASGSSGRNGFAAEYQATQLVVDFITGKKAVPGKAQAPHHPRLLSVDLDLSGGLPVEGYARMFHACICPGQPEQTLGELSVRSPAGGAPPEFRSHGESLDAAAFAARLRAVEDSAVKDSRKLPPSEMSARVASVAHEWLVILDKVSVRKVGDAPATLTELDIYVLEK